MFHTQCDTMCGEYPCRTNGAQRIRSESDIIFNGESFEVVRIKITPEFALDRLNKSIIQKQKQLDKNKGTYTKKILDSMTTLRDGGTVRVSGVNENNSVNALLLCGYAYKYYASDDTFVFELDSTLILPISDIIFWKK